MNLCSDGHQEVCYEGRNCPACEAIKDRERTIESLERRIEKLEKQVDTLQQED